MLLRIFGLALAISEDGPTDSHPTCQFALFAFAHVFDLVGQMFDVELGEPAGAQEPRLLLRPPDHVLVIGCRGRPSAQRCRSRTAAAPALLSLMA